MKRLFLRCLAALWTLSTSGFAAPKDAPLIATTSGDLWSWNGTWKRLTTSGSIEPQVVLSPDGSQVAYLSSGRPVNRRLEPGELRNSPFRVYVLELHSGKARPLSGLLLERYPADELRYTENAGLLAWSPDGERLSWMSQSQTAKTYADSSWNMAIYTLESGKIERFKMPGVGTSEDIYQMQLVWTARGLRVWVEPNAPFDSFKPSIQTGVRWYSPTGKLLALESAAQANRYFAQTRLWLRDPKGPNSQLLEGARAPLKLPLYPSFAVTSYGGSRAVLAGQTPGTVRRTGILEVEKKAGEFQMWLYQAGKLKRIKLPPELQVGVASLTWFGEVPKAK